MSIGEIILLKLIMKTKKNSRNRNNDWPCIWINGVELG